MNSALVLVGGRELSLFDMEKVLYPATGFTKGEVIQYYSQIAPALLAHVRGRPMTLKRYPNGVDAPFLYEKQCPTHAPSWVHSVPVRSKSEERTIDYCLVDDEATVVWLANLATLELHVSLSMATALESPTCVVFDLNPGPPADVIDCCKVALAIRHVLDYLGLKAFAKSSGGAGMQVYVPLNSPATYEQTKAFSIAIARRLESQMPGAVVSQMAKQLRRGRVFIDWSQNDELKPTVAVYSLRARERPTVSTPLTWDEVEQAAATGDLSAVTFEATQVLERVQRLGDIFAPVATLRQELPPFGRG